MSRTVFGDPMVAHGHRDVGPSNPHLAPFHCPWATSEAQP